MKNMRLFCILGILINIVSLSIGKVKSETLTLEEPSITKNTYFRKEIPPEVKKQIEKFLKGVQYVYANGLLNDRRGIEKALGTPISTEKEYSSYFFRHIPSVLEGGYYKIFKGKYLISLGFSEYCYTNEDIGKIFYIDFKKERPLVTDYTGKIEIWTSEIKNKKKIKIRFDEDCLTDIEIEEDFQNVN